MFSILELSVGLSPCQRDFVFVLLMSSVHLFLFPESILRLLSTTLHISWPVVTAGNLIFDLEFSIPNSKTVFQIILLEFSTYFSTCE